MQIKSFFVTTQIFALGLFIIVPLTVCSKGIYKKDSTYIKTYNENLTLKLAVQTKGLTFSIDEKNKDREIDYQYKTNNYLGPGIGFDYKWLGVTIYYGKLFSMKDRDDYGTSKSLYWTVNAFLKRANISFRLVSNNGMYAEKEESGEPIVDVRPDIEAVLLDFRYTYFLNNKKYSFKSLTSMKEEQLKKAGSFLIGGFLNISGYNADSAFCPSWHSDFQNEEVEIRNGDAFSVGSMLGYAYTYTSKSPFFVAMSSMFGIGSNTFNQYDETGKVVNSSSNFSVSLSNMLTIGVNSKKYYIRLSALSNIVSNSIVGENTISSNQWKVNIMSGIRIDTKK